MGQGANTVREALLAELLSDVDRLIDRLESMESALPRAADSAAERLQKAANGAGEKIQISSTEITKVCGELQKALTNDAKRRAEADAALEKKLSSHLSRMTVLAVALGSIAGLIGGVIGTLAFVG